jgi:enoyl-CoA hydratase/carnithine racemase
MPYRELSCKKVGHCMIVRFLSPANVPSWRNRIAADLEDLCTEVNGDEETRVVLFIYQGKDLNLKAGDDAKGGEPDGASLVASVAQLKQPVIAAVDGDAMGIGLELALACDIRIGTEGASFGLPQVCDGTVPHAGGTQRLPRLVGRGKALEMILTGAPVDAGEARRIGLLHRVVHSDELAETATELATEMAARSPLAMSYVKEALHSGLDLTIDQGMRMELDLYLLLFSTQDRIEGITAFREKRKPRFEGK